MPSRLNAPVLTLDAAKMHQVDPRNVESLFGMWTVFNKCSKSIKDGSRLENLSWRLWARETLCCPPQPDKTIVPAIDVPAGRSSQVPSLSNSPGSDSSEDSSSEGEHDNSDEKRRTSLLAEDQDSALSKSRGKEQHLTPRILKKIVLDIQEKSELTPLSPSIQASLSPPSPKPTLAASEASHTPQLHESTESCISAATVATIGTTSTGKTEHRNSDTSATSVSSDGLIRTGSVVHGFSPVSTSFRSKALSGVAGLPVPTTKLAVSPAKKPGMFQLGASSEDDESSFEHRPSALKPPPQRSSLSQSISQQKNGAVSKGQPKKTTSFRDIVEQRRMDSDAEADEGAIATDSEEEEEDDDDSVFDDDENEWEDSPSDDDKTPAQEPPTFRRVESRPDLVSRPSMLSMALDQKRRASGLQNEASRSSPAIRQTRATSHNGPSIPGSPEDHDHDEDQGLMMRGARSQARPIAMPPPNARSLAHSPRTTRRNMLSTELTESLRKNLLWERQQKSQTVNAFLKRSRNAQSMANLQAVKQPPKPAPAPSNNSWNQEFDNPWEFNSKGW